VIHHPADDRRGLVYVGGSVVTVDPARPTAAAIATRGGRIVAVGSEEDCRQAVGLDPQQLEAADGPHDGQHGPAIVDLAGRTLLPGFVDAHVHPLVLCLMAHYDDLSAARSVSEALDALADRARVAERADWVVGLGLRPEVLDERRLPTAAELDKIGDGQVVVVISSDGHRSAGNSIALKVAGIRNNTPDPIGGAFERDHQSRLTGVCHERATHVMLRMLPVPDTDQLRSLLRQVGRDLVQQGITSAGLGLQTDIEGSHGPAFAHESRLMMLLADELPIGCHAILGGKPFRAVDARAATSLHAPGRGRTVTGISVVLDGTFEGHGAWLREPYADRPGHRGWPTPADDDIATHMENAHLEGLQICVHAVGDAAVDRAIELFAGLQARHPDDGRGPRHRVEHAALVDERAAARLAELDVAAVLRPRLARAQVDWLTDRLGAGRADEAHPFPRLSQAGVLVAAASDASLGDLDQLASIAHTPLPVDEALAVHTRHAAATLHQDHEVGMLREGHRADLVVLSGDPTSVPTETGTSVADITVESTVVGGRLVV
jgi:predicted amidohydrolase YtcJ